MALRRLATVAIACSLVLGVAHAAPAAQSPFAGRIGVDTHVIYDDPQAAFDYLRRARAGGITWVREDFAWSVIEPERNRFVWDRPDAFMRNTARLGIDVLAIAAYAPPWASGHADSDKYPPVAAADYARFVAAIVRRYGPGGTFWASHPTLEPRPIRAIELWNEPWLSVTWRPAPDPAAYARLVRAAATAVKSIDRHVGVLASADLWEYDDSRQSGEWLGPLLAADPDLWRGHLVDAWSLHVYSQSYGPSDTSAPDSVRFDRLLLVRDLAAAADAAKPIWITEVGWRVDQPRPDAVSEAEQAQYLHDGLVRALGEWGSLVQRAFVYEWTDPAAFADGGGYNLVRPDGSTRPAWDAIKQLLASGA